MKSLLKKPYLLFWLAIPIILLVGILDDNSLDIAIHDIYFVFYKRDCCILVSIIFGFLGLGYWLMKTFYRKLTKWLNWIHIFLTIGGLITLFIVPYFYEEDNLGTSNAILTLTTLVMVFGQLFYLINIIIGIFNKDNVLS